MMTKEYNPKNPDSFKQVELPPPILPTLNIVPVAEGQSTIGKGDFQSKNFKTGETGFRIRENGDSEFQGMIVGGLVVDGILLSPTLYGASTNGTDSYTLTVTPPPTQYNTGLGVFFNADVANTGAASLNINGLGVKSIKKNVSQDLADGDIPAGSLSVLVYDGTNFQLLSPVRTNKFGGTGADGALSITSGTTTIDLGNAAVVTKNYTSISITGTGALAFSNPHANGTVIILKSQGNVTLTSSATPMIDASGMGAEGGDGGVEVSATDSAQGTSGNNGITERLITDGGDPGTGCLGGTKPSAYQFSVTLTNNELTKIKYPNICVGSGGGGGTALQGLGTPGTITGGKGGRGGGCLIIECGGAWNFTTASGISVAGKNGAVGSNSGGVNYCMGGGGGGGAGQFLALYNTLTANSGTITVSGGTGANSTGNFSSTYGGGGGASSINNGSNGADAAPAAQSGGNGATGDSKVLANTEFA